jgi:uncharacterized surface protein with fasciclin (FAS1) repeats
VSAQEHTDRKQAKQGEKQKMKSRLKRLVVATSIVGVVAMASNLWASSCSSSGMKSTATESEGASTVVALAQSSDQFNTLVAAIQAADLAEVLQAEGPYTVFAPTDAAFAKLPDGTIDTLLKPENKDQLAAILKYHVVPGRVMAADVKTMKAETAQGQSVQLTVNDSGVFVNDAKVVKTDLVAANGVVHVIDSVILPQS